MPIKRKRAKFIIGAYAIIFDKNHRCLWCHRRDYDLWNLPGGGVEYGETPEEAVIRELKEKTGVTVKVKRLVGIYCKTKEKTVAFSFECRIVKGKLMLSDEVSENKYYKISELPKHVSYKQVERVKDALKFNKNIFLKKQSSIKSIELFKLKKLSF